MPVKRSLAKGSCPKCRPGGGRDDFSDPDIMPWLADLRQRALRGRAEDLNIFIKFKRLFIVAVLDI
jgi:hypothetical protein